MQGDDLDLWGPSGTPNQILTTKPGSKPGKLQFKQQNGTCVSGKGGVLRMAACVDGAAEQQWSLEPSSLSPGSFSIQSVSRHLDSDHTGVQVYRCTGALIA